MLGGKLAYAALQALLLWASLRVVGGPVAPVVVASAFVVERVLSMVVLTPGATGVVEVGMAGVLGALGAEPAAAAAGVLLYRGLVVGMEVPVGGLALLGWWVGHRRAAASDAGARPPVVVGARPVRPQVLPVPVPAVALVRGLTAPPAQRYSAKKPATSSGCSVT